MYWKTVFAKHLSDELLNKDIAQSLDLRLLYAFF